MYQHVILLNTRQVYCFLLFVRVCVWDTFLLYFKIKKSAEGPRLFIRRRVAWIIGEYEPSLRDDLRPHAYESLIILLRDKVFFE